MLIYRRLPPKLFLLAVALAFLIVGGVWLTCYLLDLREQAAVTQEQLFAAVNQGDLSEVIRCLKAKPQLARARDARGQTVLHLAAGKDMAETTLLLLNLGADPSLKDAEGKTALELAVARNAVHAEKVLREKAGAP